MNRRYTKREFLQQASLTGVGLLLTSCPPTTDAAPRVETPELRFPDPTGDAHPKAADSSVTYIRPGERQYETLRQGINKRIQKKPRVIALCRDTQGVAAAVKYAVQHRLPIAIKSGGHCFEGFSCNDDGLVINLSPLKTVKWIDQETIRVGPGCMLSQLYDEVLPHGRIVPSGSCGSVGVGGLTLGGGYGFFSRKYGLTCDSLKEVTLVDGRGAIRSSKTDPELLWACRGGGNGNFGVVTEMVFQTHPAPKVFYSHRFKTARLDAGRADLFLKRWFEIVSRLPETCFSAYVLNGAFLTILVTDFAAPSKPLQEALKALGEISSKTEPGIARKPAIALRAFYGASKPLSFKNSSAGCYHDYAEIQKGILPVLEKVVNHPGLIYQVNTLGGAIANPAFARVSAYPHRTRPFLAELQAYWDAPDQGDRLQQACREVQQLLRQNGVAAHYVNYPNIEFEDWQHAYYGESYLRLQTIKRKYDPENNFRYAQSVAL